MVRGFRRVWREEMEEDKGMNRNRGVNGSDRTSEEKVKGKKWRFGVAQLTCEHCQRGGR